MKILHVCETAIGGVASYLNMICDIDPLDHNVLLVPENHVQGLDTHLDIRTYASKGRSLSAILSMIRATQRAIKQEDPDIVFFHSTFSLLAMAAMRVLFPTRKFIYCAHGWGAAIFEDNSRKQRIVRLVEGTLSGAANRVVVISSADMQMAEKYNYFGKMVLIENAVCDRTKEPGPDRFVSNTDDLHLLFVGRFDKQKGLDLLLSGFEKARETRSDLHLHVIGAAIRADGGSLEVPDGVSLSDWVDKGEIDGWYASADALVVPSRWEGFGLVVPEALRNGTPVLVSNRGALPSLIEPGVTGEVFELSPDHIADCLTALDKSDLKNRRSAARASYEARFGFDRLSRQISDLYKDVAAT